MTIYCVKYQYQRQVATEYFKTEQLARKRFTELYRESKQENGIVTDVELQADTIMRPSADTVLRILNGEAYVLNRKILIPAPFDHVAKAAAKGGE